MRVAIKQFMHLPSSITNGVIYCGKGDGGLGFPKLEHLVTRVSLGAGLKFTSSNDPAVRALSGCATTIARLQRLALSARLPYPYTTTDLKQYKFRTQKEELKRWSALQSQGRAVDSLAGDKVGNAIFYNPTLLKPCRFTTALQFRTNTAGNRTSLNCAIPQVDLNCRKCGAAKETLGHISGQCILTKAARHDEIRDLMMDRIMEMDKTADVTKEPELHSVNGKLKPDLVIKNQRGVFVVDVTVRHEDEDYLKIAKEEKQEKYGILLPAMQQERGAPTAEVLPIVVGTRGAMPTDTIKCLQKLGMGRSYHKTISLMALRSSITPFWIIRDKFSSIMGRRPVYVGGGDHNLLLTRVGSPAK
ncbi:uncharacterized protein LOC110828025 [Zootermopsis nevadensis]|uniref:uncharacterized protein LOC110828025 n=1 Tax=Zootermopsis nevadensis TaxID=136037 RepID=UPI000B8EAEBB|nr:uncharacterized protein LOC110828025 [Zootermopsis nevadensis]